MDSRYILISLLEIVQNYEFDFVFPSYKFMCQSAYMVGHVSQALRGIFPAKQKNAHQDGTAAV
jgi:hypothetical protein